MEERNAKRVFVIYGRNRSAYSAMVSFLQSLGLDAQDFTEVGDEVGASAFIGDIVQGGMDRAQAYVVLLTPDERAALHPKLRKGGDSGEESERWQARPNVLLEAGMALAIAPKRTLLVVLGKVALPSDLAGRRYIRLDNSTGTRKELKEGLKAIGCPIKEAGQWHTTDIAGDFEACLRPPVLPEITVESPFGARGVTNDGHGKGSCHIRLGNIFDGPCDMVVLACSAKGTISKGFRAWSDQFGIPLPLPMRAGDIQVIPFPGPGSLTRLVVWAASVLNDHSTPQTIESIGRKLGEYTAGHPDVNLIWAPLLGAGAGGLTPEVSAASLKRGFKSAAAADATLVITALQADLVERARRASSEK